MAGEMEMDWFVGFFVGMRKNFAVFLIDYVIGVWTK